MLKQKNNFLRKALIFLSVFILLSTTLILPCFAQAIPNINGDYISVSSTFITNLADATFISNPSYYFSKPLFYYFHSIEYDIYTIYFTDLFLELYAEWMNNYYNTDILNNIDVVMQDLWNKLQ